MTTAGLNIVNEPGPTTNRPRSEECVTKWRNMLAESFCTIFVSQTQLCAVSWLAFAAICMMVKLLWNTIWATWISSRLSSAATSTVWCLLLSHISLRTSYNHITLWVNDKHVRLWLVVALFLKAPPVFSRSLSGIQQALPLSVACTALEPDSPCSPLSIRVGDKMIKW